MTDAAKYSESYWKLVRASLKEELTDDEFEVLKYKASTLELDPLMGHLFPVKRKNRRTNSDQVEVQTNVDAQRLMADRTDKLLGISEPEFQENGEKYPKLARVVVKKLVFRGEAFEPATAEFSAVAYWSEYYPGEGNAGFMYRNKPHTMLGKCAEALALRKAFPAETGGLYTVEEMAQAAAEDAESGSGSSRPSGGKRGRQSETQNPRTALVGVDPETITISYGNKGTKGKTIAELKDGHLEKIYGWSMNAERHANFLNSHAVEIEAMRRALVKRGHVEYKSDLDDQLAEEAREAAEVTESQEPPITGVIRPGTDEEKPEPHRTAEERNEEERREFAQKKEEAKRRLQAGREEPPIGEPPEDLSPTEDGELPL